MELTASELMVLGLVVEKPSHGYDLDRTIAARGIRQWANLAFSSIYYVLGKLEVRGLVRSTRGGGPKSRRVYSVTTKGRSAAETAAAAMLSTAAPSFSPFVVGLANIDLVDSAQFHTLIRNRAFALSEQVAAITTARESQGELPAAAHLVFSYTLASLVAERDWLTTLESGETSP
jgi:DNA-binding PadR family transcriptional regulator